MKLSDPLLLADGTLRCRMYPEHLATPGFPQCNHTVSKLVHCVVKYSRPPDLKCQPHIHLDYRPQLRFVILSLSNPFQ